MEGNQMKIREALVNLTRFTEVDIRGLENLAKYAIDHSMYGGGVLRAVAGAIRESKKSLAAPPRNCDVGTAEEQVKRYAKFCDIHDCRSDCPLFKANSCKLAWAQMPYEQEGGEK